MVLTLGILTEHCPTLNIAECIDAELDQQSTWYRWAQGEGRGKVNMMGHQVGKKDLNPSSTPRQ